MAPRFGGVQCWRKTHMINANHEELTADALAGMERTRDPRLGEFMVGLVPGEATLPCAPIK
jgi:hypothetical protein